MVRPDFCRNEFEFSMGEVPCYITSVKMQEPHVDRSSLPMLHPARQNGAKWFRHHPQVSTAVRKVFQSCFRGPWYSWRKVPGRYKITWFALFKKRFNWDPAIGQEVAAEFKKFAAYRLKAMVSFAKKQRERPDWISIADWAVMQNHWATPKAQAHSEKARAARMSDRNGLGPHSHRAGSRSFVRVQDILEANNEDSSFISVMKKTHQKPDGTYADQQGRVVAEAYEKHVQERLVQLQNAGEENVTAEILDQREKNELYVKAATEVSKKGNVFGLGALGSKVVVDVGASLSAVPVEELEVLTQKLQEMEAELKQSREENMEFQKRLDAMEEIVETLGNQIF